MDNTIKMWDRVKQLCVKDFDVVHEGGITCMAMTYDGEHLFTTDGKGFMKLWNVKDCTLEHDYGRIFKSKITALAITN